MATGTGKTITAISAIVKVLEACTINNIPCGLIVVVPYKSLLEQWIENLEEFNINPIRCYESKTIWESKLNYKIELFNSKISKNLFIITTNATFNSDIFQSQLKSIKNDYILCIDEMHHAATDKYLLNLPKNCKLRLGLSATLDSEFNSINMDKLKNYFGEVIFKFDMNQAIESGFLTPYYYYPVFVELTNDEKDEYFILSKKIGKLMSVCKDDNESLTSLLMKRARIIASCENKIKKLIELKPIIKDKKYNIFYCGDKIDNGDKYIYKVNRIVSNELGLNTHTFTSEESKEERIKIIEDFKCGKLDAISAIKCLDEGIDIPELRTAFILSSSTNPKEFIQRRGRILRLCKGKSYAEIYDFIVIPTLNEDYIRELTDDELKAESKIFLREVKRFDEFAKLAINGIDAHKKIMDIWDLYDL